MSTHKILRCICCVSLFIINFLSLAIGQQVPDTLNIQGKLLQSTPILGVNADILVDDTTAQSLVVDLIPDENGVFTAVLNDINKSIFKTGSNFFINFSSSTGELLGAIPLNGVPFAFRAESSASADSANTLSSNPNISGILTADYIKSNNFMIIESWTMVPKISETDSPLIFQRGNNKGEVRIKSQLSLQGNLARYSAWYNLPARIPALKWIMENSDNYFKWRIRPILTQSSSGSPGHPATYKVTDIRLDLDSSFYKHLLYLYIKM